MRTARAHALGWRHLRATLQAAQNRLRACEYAIDTCFRRAVTRWLTRIAAEALHHSFDAAYLRRLAWQRTWRTWARASKAWAAIEQARREGSCVRLRRAFVCWQLRASLLASIECRERAALSLCLWHVWRFWTRWKMRRKMREAAEATRMVRRHALRAWRRGARWLGRTITLDADLRRQARQLRVRIELRRWGARAAMAALELLAHEPIGRTMHSCSIQLTALSSRCARRALRRWSGAADYLGRLQASGSRVCMARLQSALITWHCAFLALCLEQAGHAQRRLRLPTNAIEERARHRKAAQLLRCWRRWVVMIDAAACRLQLRLALRVWCASVSARAALLAQQQRLRRRRVARSLVLWAQHWWVTSILPDTFARRAAWRSGYNQLLAATLEACRVEAEMRTAAISWNFLRSHLKVIRRLFRHCWRRRTAQAVSAEQHALNRLATLAETLEAWRLPRRRSLALQRSALDFRWSHLLGAWSGYAGLYRKKLRVIDLGRRSLLRRTLGSWIGYTFTPQLRYARFLEPLVVSAAQLPQPAAPWVPPAAIFHPRDPHALAPLPTPPQPSARFVPSKGSRRRAGKSKASPPALTLAAAPAVPQPSAPLDPD